MTSTPFNVGLGDGSRSSSRVLRPPGGGHTDIFGGEPEPTRGRRPGPPPPPSQIGQGDEPAKPTNGAVTPNQNGQASEPQAAPEPAHAPAPAPSPQTPPESVKTLPESVNPKAVTPTDPKCEPPKRVRVPPGGFSSGLCMSESIGCGSNEDAECVPQADVSSSTIDDAQFAANIDLRYGGQYLTPEQLPEFCNQLHHLVEVIRNIQSYAKVTDEYPSELERRLEREAQEVAAIAREVRNARDSASRTRLQRRALRAQRAQILAHLAKLREAEVRELESSVRLSDRKLYKSWEAVRDSTDPVAFEPLLEEVRNKQAALDCLVRLIENRRKNLPFTRAPHPLPPPPGNDEDSVQIGGFRRRQNNRVSKRRRKETTREPRSVPLSEEPSHHSPQQVTLYIQGPAAGSESTSRFRAGSAGAVTLGSLELPTPASVRDILFFTTD